MTRVVLILAVVALGLYCLIECVQTDRRQVRYLPKWLWLFLILIPVVGPGAWLVGGRPRTPKRPARGQRSAAPRPAPVQPAPDDDPAFLARLDQQARLAARDEELLRAERARSEQSRREQAQTKPAQSTQAEPTQAEPTQHGHDEAASDETPNAHQTGEQPHPDPAGRTGPAAPTTSPGGADGDRRGTDSTGPAPAQADPGEANRTETDRDPESRRDSGS